MLSQSVIEAAQAAQRKWKVPASVSLAQYANESAWGTKIPPGSHNYFGIKAIFGQPYVTATTSEYLNGQWVRIPQNFAKYASDAEGFDAHGKFLGLNKRYAPAFKTKSAEDFARAIAKAGYATAPGYGDALVKLMRDYHLEQYDVLPVVPVTPTKPPVAIPPAIQSAVPEVVIVGVLWVLGNLFGGWGSTLIGSVVIMYAFSPPQPADWQLLVSLGLMLILGTGGPRGKAEPVEESKALPPPPETKGKAMSEFATVVKIFEVTVPLLEKLLPRLIALEPTLANLEPLLNDLTNNNQTLTQKLTTLEGKISAVVPAAPDPAVELNLQGLLDRLAKLEESVNGTNT